MPVKKQASSVSVRIIFKYSPINRFVPYLFALVDSVIQNEII